MPTIPPNTGPIIDRKKTVILSPSRDFIVEKLRIILRRNGIDDSKISDEQLENLKSIKEVKSIEGGAKHKLESFEIPIEASTVKEKEISAQLDNENKAQVVKKKEYLQTIQLAFFSKLYKLPKQQDKMDPTKNNWYLH